MLRALIIDDEENAISTIKLMIEKFIEGVKVVGSCTDAREGAELIDNFRPEIVFLDVQMPHLNGFELLEKTNYKEFELIFITAHEQYALQALKKSALDYLLKPVDPEELKKTIERVKNKQKKHDYSEALNLFNELKKENKERLRITIPVSGGFEYEFADNIMRIEADSNYASIYLKDLKKHSVRKTLKEFETLLCTPGSNFMRVHESHLVNLNCVIRFVKEEPSYIVTKDNIQIPIARAKRAEFLEWVEK